MTAINFEITAERSNVALDLDVVRKALKEAVTPHRKAFAAMGFKLQEVELEYDISRYNLWMRARFQCVCGQDEYVTLSMSEELLRIPLSVIVDRIDPARLAIEGGATSPEHLRRDGYPEDVIEEIQRKGKEALAELC